MKKSLTLNELFPTAITGNNGIFHYLQQFDVPWKTEGITDSLDTLYFSHSGEKTASPFLMAYVEDGEIIGDDEYYIAEALYRYFNINWTKLYNTLSFEYDPIENYRMVEVEDTVTHNEISETETGTVSRDADNEYGHTGTDATQNNLTETETGTVSRDADNQRTDTGTLSNSGTDSNTNSVYGFNSSTMVDSDASSASNSNTETHNLTLTDDIDETETRNLSKSNTGTVTETKNLTDTETLDETETRNLSNESESDGTNNRELTRSGNIGVTTSQQMIDSERALWRWNFFSVVFSDIDSILCLDIYDYSECDY